MSAIGPSAGPGEKWESGTVISGSTSIGMGATKDLAAMASAETAVFGVLHTLNRRKSRNFGYSMMQTTVNFVQLLQSAFLVFDGRTVEHRAADGGNTNPLDMEAIVSGLGYPAYTKVLAVVSTLLLLGYGICWWVVSNFKTGHMPFVWPLKLLRFIVRVFIGLFFINTVVFLLIAVDCASEPAGYLEAFSDRWCWSWQHLPLGLFALILTVTFILAATCINLVEFSPWAHDVPLATPDPTFPVHYFTVHTVMAISNNVLSAQPKLLGPMLMFMGMWLTYDVLSIFPFYNRAVNRLSAVLYAALATSGACATLFAYGVGDIWLKYVMWAPMALAGVGALWYCRRGDRFVLDDEYFHEDPATGRLACSYHFATTTEVELMCRAVIDDPTQEVIDQTDAILLRGLALFPESCFLHYLYSEFLDHYPEDRPRAMIYAEKVRRHRPNFQYRYWLFSRAHRRVLDRAGSGGGGDMNLVTYVEFQKHYHDAARALRSTMRSIYGLWSAVSEEEVVMGDVAHSLASIISRERRCDITLKTLHAKYPHSPKALRMRARFLSLVKQQHDAARLLLSEAAQLEQRGSSGGEGATAALGLAGFSDGGAVDETVDAIFVIDASGIMRDVNANAVRMFGYRRDELIGNNISCVCPTPFRELHDMFLNRYINTGVSRVIGKPRKLWAQHNLGYAFPIGLLVNTVDAPDGGVLFAGVLHKEQPAVSKTVVVDANGTILFGTEAFFAAFTDNPFNLIGQSLSRVLISFATSPDCMRDFTEGIAMGLSTDGYTQRLKVKVERQAAAGLEWWVVQLFDLQDRSAVVKIDQKGTIVAVNHGMLDLFGYAEKELLGSNIALLMPLPYSHYHASYLRRFIESGRAHFLKHAKRRRTVTVKHRDGHHFRIELSIKMIGSRMNNPIFEGLIKLSEDTLEVKADTSDYIPRAVVSADGEIREANDPLADTLDTSAAQCLGRNMLDILPSLELNLEDGQCAFAIDAAAPGNGAEILVGYCLTAGANGVITATDDDDAGTVPPSRRDSEAGGSSSGHGGVPLPPGATMSNPFPMGATASTPPKPSTDDGGQLFTVEMARIDYMEALLMLDSGGCIVSITPSASLLLGVTPHGAVGRSIEEFCESMSTSQLHTRFHGILSEQRDVVHVLHSCGERLYAYAEMSQNAEGYRCLRLDAKLGLPHYGNYHGQMPADALLNLGDRTRRRDSVIVARQTVGVSRSKVAAGQLDGRYSQIASVISNFDLQSLVGQLVLLSRVVHFTLLGLFLSTFIVLWLYANRYGDKLDMFGKVSDLHSSVIHIATETELVMRADDPCASLDDLVHYTDELEGLMTDVFRSGEDSMQALVHDEYTVWEQQAVSGELQHDSETLWALSRSFLRASRELQVVVCQDDDDVVGDAAVPYFFLTNNSAAFETAALGAADEAYDVGIEAHGEIVDAMTVLHLGITGMCVVFVVLAMLPLLTRLSRRRTELFRLFVSLPRVARMEMLTIARQREAQAVESGNSNDADVGIIESDDDDDDSGMMLSDDDDDDDDTSGGRGGGGNSQLNADMLSAIEETSTTESKPSTVDSNNLGGLGSLTAGVAGYEASPSPGPNNYRPLQQSQSQSPPPPQQTDGGGLRARKPAKKAPGVLNVGNVKGVKQVPAPPAATSPDQPVVGTAARLSMHVSNAALKLRKRQFRVTELHVMHTQLKQTLRLIIQPIMPILICLIFVIVSYVVHVELTQATGTALRLFVVSQAVPQVLQMREAAALLVHSNGTDAEARAALVDARADFRESHHGLLYGSSALELSSSLYDFTDEERALLYEPSCLRSGVRCLNESDPLYDHTHWGLDSLLEVYERAAQELVDSCQGCVDADSSTAYRIVYELGEYDVIGGLKRWMEIITDRVGSEQQAEVGFSSLVLIFYVLASSFVYKRLTKTILHSLSREWMLITALLASIPGRYNVVEHVQKLEPFLKRRGSLLSPRGRRMDKHRVAAGS